jgi:NDP-sugar pyrophosphorylase family protein
MINIVVPMAGRGSRFSIAGFTEPKPLIPIHGIPMIRWVIANLSLETSHRFIFVVHANHVKELALKERLSSWSPSCEIVEVPDFTDGAARSVLAAKHLIDSDWPLIVANSDQWVDADIEDFASELFLQNRDGLVMTMKSSDPKWSFVEVDENGTILRIAEKEVISEEATVGIYAFRKGSQFVDGAERMIAAGETIRGEFYVAPVYNYLIEQGQEIGIYSVDVEGQGMYGLGTPDDLETFKSSPRSLKIRGQKWK